MHPAHAVVIQGGGPVGLACATWLLQKNPRISLTLMDRNPPDDELIQSGDQRGIALSHGSKLLLDTINAWPPNCPTIHRIHVSQAGRFGRAIMTREELGQDALGHISRYRDIHLTLRKSLRALQAYSPNFVWHHNADEGFEPPTAACVVHAEGGLFKQQDWVESGRDYHQAALVGTVDVEHPIAHQAWERFTDEGPLALLPSHLGPNTHNLVWCASPESSQRRLALSDDEFLNELERSFGQRLGRFTKIANRRLYDLGLNYRKDICMGHEVWIGNAAQTLHPVAGQGLNLGFRDAYLLAEKLADLFKQAHTVTPDAIEAQLAEYAKSRQVDRRATIGITDFLARVFTSSFLPIQVSRGLALGVLAWLPPMKVTLAKQMMFGRR